VYCVPRKKNTGGKSGQVRTAAHSFNFPVQGAAFCMLDGQIFNMDKGPPPYILYGMYI